MLNQKFEVMLTRKELKILKFALIEWRNCLIQNDYSTDDVDRILVRLYK